MSAEITLGITDDPRLEFTDPIARRGLRAAPVASLSASCATTTGERVWKRSVFVASVVASEFCT